MNEEEEYFRGPESLIIRMVDPSEKSKFLKIINLVEAILKKSVETRNATDQTIINKFISQSETLTQISNATSIDTVKQLLKYSSINDIEKNHVVERKGKDIEEIVIMLCGKFGVEKDEKNSKNELIQEISNEEKYRQIVDRIPLIMKDLKRKKFYINFDMKKGTQMETEKMDAQFQTYQEINKEGIFDLDSLVEGRKYKQTLFTCSPCKILTISSKIFYEVFQAFLKKRKADKISAFRKFECFSLIEDDKLLKIVEQVSIIKKKKGSFVYKEGEQFQCIYLLFTGTIKVTKTIELFKQNPNELWINRSTLHPTNNEVLPYANLSSVYNYQPRTKVVELGDISLTAIFGEEQYYADMNRQVNAQVSSPEATYYEINLSKLESWVPERRGFLQDFTKIIYQNRTKKKILFRQQKLAELIQIENKNNMDYFYIEEGKKKVQAKVNKFKINKVNKVISPEKLKKKANLHPPLYNVFNFTKLDKAHKKNKSLSHQNFSKEQTNIAQLIHGVETTSIKQRRSQIGKKFSIDINNPLFQISYFEKNRKETLRIEKESRMRTIVNRSQAITSRNKTHRTNKYFDLPEQP